MALEYIGQMLEDAVDEVSSLEIRGRVDQVVGTIIRASVPGVKPYRSEQSPIALNCDLPGAPVPFWCYLLSLT